MIRKKSLFDSDDDNPTEYVINIVDCMLVLAVGFMLFAIISMDVQDIVFSDMSQNEKNQAIKQKINLEKGKIIDEPLDFIDDSSGEYYNSVGEVYKDPKSGKLVMIPK